METKKQTQSKANKAKPANKKSKSKKAGLLKKKKEVATDANQLILSMRNPFLIAH